MVTKVVIEKAKKLLDEGQGSVPMIYNFTAKIEGSVGKIQTKLNNGIEGNTYKIGEMTAKTGDKAVVITGRYESSYPKEGFQAKAQIIDALGSISGVKNVEIMHLEMVY